MCESDARPMERIVGTTRIREQLHRMFTDEFMEKYTSFQTFEAFRYSSAVLVNWDADIWHYSPELLDLFVRESTCFTSWDEMVRAAGQLQAKC